MSCDHSIQPESIIRYEDEMIGYCANCGTRVAFPHDPFLVGSENMLTEVIGQLASGEDPTWQFVADTIADLSRIAVRTKELRELLDLIERMYEEQLDGELGNDLQREALVAQHGAQVALHDASEECGVLEEPRPGGSGDCGDSAS